MGPQVRSMPNFTDRTLKGLRVTPARKIAWYSTATAPDWVCGYRTGN